MAAENLMNMTQNFMTPDMLNKFSGALGQPSDKVQSGLKSVIPTFIMGLVNKGSTKEGAEGIVNMVNRQGLDSAVAPSNLNDEGYLKKGIDVVSGVFGNNLNSVVSGLGSSTGLNSSSITKMLGMIAPLVMGAFGSKIKREGLNASGVQGFLSQQKSNISGFLPSGENLYVRRESEGNKRSWGIIALLAFVGLGLFWWISHRNSAVKTMPTETVRSTDAVESATLTETLAPQAASVSELNDFINSGVTTELPKRFNIENLNFSTGTATLAPGANSDLDAIATAMKAHPKAMARIEGFTDSTGDISANNDLSQARAQTVKDQLVSRGVNAGHLEASGQGASKPVSNNASDAGRAENRRIEFVVTGLK